MPWVEERQNKQSPYDHQIGLQMPLHMPRFLGSYDFMIKVIFLLVFLNKSIKVHD